ncbi:tetratricopeptide repeat protein [Salinicola aestuarinus]|uniref:tetratricopeptide repeat protein n=1 Tax=Salinicola aestuarinus TaxID=1949082 RepID=UPI00165EC29E|nr:tetratricopeptide repeat protein [Salinicola aestuarinus]
MAKRLLYAAGCAALLTGCQGMSADSTAPPHPDPMRNAPPITRGFDAQGLSDVMLAEMAGQRGDFRRAALGYQGAARRYRSAALAERATLAARYTEDTDLLSSTADLWQTLAPEDDAPEALLSGIAIDRGEWALALRHRLELSRQGGDGQLLALVDLALESGVALGELVPPLRAYADAHPADLDPGLAMARLEAVGGDPTAALARIDRLSAMTLATAELWLVQSQIALEAGNTGLAESAARRGLALAPGDSRFFLALAQSAISRGDIPAAEGQIDRLLQRYPDNPTLRLALARLYLQFDAPAPAQRLLLPLLDRDNTPPGAYLLLASIAEQRGETDNALLYYRQVPPGPGFNESRALAIRMLARDARYAALQEFVRVESLRHARHRTTLTQLGIEALDSAGQMAAADALLSDALTQAPDDNDLLYTRAMRDYAQGNLARMLETLETLVDRDPNDAAALNALGYTLATETDRLDEALSLVERAAAIEPDSPAILDSLGWIHFKLGDSQLALDYLQRAYAAVPDQEIAAHYAETLLTLGQTEKAKRVVNAALSSSETHPDIDDLLRRHPELGLTTSSSISTGRTHADAANGQ